MREYYEQLYANKFDNLGEMDNFRETYSLPKLNQEELDQLNRLIIRNEIEYVIRILPTNKSPGLDGFKVNSTKHTKRKLYPSSLNFFKRLKKKEHTQRHSITITLFPKPDKDTTKKENCWPISLMNRDAKILNKILAN